MISQTIRITRAGLGRKITRDEVPGPFPVGPGRRLQQRALQRQLGVCRQHGQFGSRKPNANATHRLPARRKERHLSIEQPGVFELIGQNQERLDIVEASLSIQGQGQALTIIIVQHHVADFVARLDKKAIAFVVAHLDGVDARRWRQQNLEIDLVIGEVDAAGIINRVRIDATAS